MGWYIVRRLLAGRLLQGAVSVVLVTTITFFLIHLVPGDPFAATGEAEPFGGAVILVNDRPPPLDDVVFHGGGTRRRGMDGNLEG